MTKERKQTISRRFSRAASTYDAHALVQKECALRLLELLPEDFRAATVLEIGCGTGNYTELLHSRFPEAGITALDFAGAMVAEAERKLGGREGITFLRQDGEEYLERMRTSFDLITSNATLQWFDDLNRAFAAIAGGVAPAGMFHGSLFGPRSLQELAAGLTALFGEGVELAAARFAGLERIESAARACFEEVSLSERFYSRSYRSLMDLLNHIKKTGAGGYHRSTPYLSKARLRELSEWFSAQGGFTTTYQVIFVTARGRKEK